jgi:hypothetical protein
VASVSISAPYDFPSLGRVTDDGRVIWVAVPNRSGGRPNTQAICRAS